MLKYAGFLNWEYCILILANGSVSSVNHVTAWVRRARMEHLTDICEHSVSAEAPPCVIYTIIRIVCWLSHSLKIDAPCAESWRWGWTVSDPNRNRGLVSPKGNGLCNGFGTARMCASKLYALTHSTNSGINCILWSLVTISANLGESDCRICGFRVPSFCSARGRLNANFSVDAFFLCCLLLVLRNLSASTYVFRYASSYLLKSVYTKSSFWLDLAVCHMPYALAPLALDAVK